MKKNLRTAVLFTENIFYNRFRVALVLCLSDLPDRTYSHVYT